jgi:hypothetical protein
MSVSVNMIATQAGPLLDCVDNSSRRHSLSVLIMDLNVRMISASMICCV